MKNKRKEHAGIIENFLEQSQQDQVMRHDLIDVHSVSWTPGDILQTPPSHSIKSSRLWI